MPDDIAISEIGRKESTLSSTASQNGSAPTPASRGDLTPAPKAGGTPSTGAHNSLTNPQDHSTLSSESLEENTKSPVKAVSTESAWPTGAMGEEDFTSSGATGEKSRDDALAWFNEKLSSLGEIDPNASEGPTNVNPTEAVQTSEKGASAQQAAPVSKAGPEKKKTSLDSLIDMFKDPSLPGKTARERMQYVLDKTRNGISSMHFAQRFDDSGFNSDFQDGKLLKNPELSNNQVGHFLTAVDCASTRGPAYYGYQRAAIGHEKVGDGEGGVLNSIRQTWQTNHEDVTHFESAVESAKAGKRDDVKKDMAKILTDLPYEHEPWPASHPRRGNSHQDLALTAYGYALEQKIQDGSLATAQDVAQWLEKNLK